MFYLGRLDFPMPQLYVVMVIVVVVLFFLSVKIYNTSDDKKHRTAFVLSSLANVGPIISLLVAVWVFTISHSHPTAQLSGGSSYWGIWFSFWLFSLFLHFTSFILIVISFTLEHNLREYKSHLYYRVATVTLLLVSFYCVGANMPDA